MKYYYIGHLILKVLHTVESIYPISEHTEF